MICLITVDNLSLEMSMSCVLLEKTSVLCETITRMNQSSYDIIDSTLSITLVCHGQILNLEI